MPRGKILCEEEKGKMVALKENGYCNAQIGRILGRSREDVRGFFKRRNNAAGNKKRGPKPKLTTRKSRQIKRYIKSNPFTTATQIIQALGCKFSRFTLYRGLKASNHIWKKVKPKRLLNEKHISVSYTHLTLPTKRIV